MQSKAHPVAYFTRQNPFSRFTGATGARACKSNARCPLVNLRINTHRVEIIYAAGASTSPFPFSVPPRLLSSAFPFLFLSSPPSPLSSRFTLYFHEASRFSERASVPEGFAREDLSRQERSSLYPLACRSLRLMDVDTPIISRSAGNITNILFHDDVYTYIYIWRMLALICSSIMRGMFTDTLGIITGWAKGQDLGLDRIRNCMSNEQVNLSLWTTSSALDSSSHYRVRFF